MLSERCDWLVGLVPLIVFFLFVLVVCGVIVTTLDGFWRRECEVLSVICVHCVGESMGRKSVGICFVFGVSPSACEFLRSVLSCELVTRVVGFML